MGGRIWAGAAVLGAGLLLAGCGEAPAEEPRRHPAAHVIRITAALEFDGRRVAFDELIDCEAYFKGTLTSPQSMFFRLSRWLVFHEVPGGGMIGFRADRELCYQLPHVWGAATGEHLPPEGWTPVIEWYDDRDLGKAETGILYLSETALTAQNGRLRIVEPFRLTIPEHPPGDALIAEAARQASERDFWRGGEVPETERMALDEFGTMEWMFPIRADEWRNPERAKRAVAVLGEHAPVDDFGALARYLEPYLGGQGFVRLPGPWTLDESNRDAANVLKLLAVGRRSGLREIAQYGIPMADAPRNGQLIYGSFAERIMRDPFKPVRFDDYVPFTCVDGVVTPDADNPGLVYWFHDRCSHQDHFGGFDFFGRPVEGRTFPYSMNDAIILDRRSGDLWWVRTST